MGLSATRLVYLGGWNAPLFSGCELAVRGGGSENVLLGWPAIAFLVEIVWREAKTFQRISERPELSADLIYPITIVLISVDRALSGNIIG